MFERIGNFIETFLSEYGVSFAMLILAGLIIAFIVEISLKKAFAYLEGKFEGKEKLLELLNILKMGAIFIVTILMSLISVRLIMESELPLPGNKALAPFWFALVYGAQYIFSMYGIKGILNLKHRPKAEKPQKEPKPKKVNPVEGMEKLAKNVYRDAEGHLYDKKGVRL